MKIRLSQSTIEQLEKIEGLKNQQLFCVRCEDQIISYPYASGGRGDIMKSPLCIECYMKEEEYSKAKRLIEQHEEFEEKVRTGSLKLEGESCCGTPTESEMAKMPKIIMFRPADVDKSTIDKLLASSNGSGEHMFKETSDDNSK